VQKPLSQLGTLDDLDDELEVDQIAQLYAHAGALIGFTTDNDDADTIATMMASSPGMLASLNREGKKQLIEALLEGPTGEEDEAAIEAIFDSMTPDDARAVLAEIGAENLADSVDDDRVGRIMVKALDFTGLDPEDDDSDQIAQSVASNPSVLAQITEADRLILIQSLFDGPTGPDEEQAALTILLSAPTGAQLERLVCALGWRELDDELGSADIDQITTQLTNRLTVERSVLRQIEPWVSDHNIPVDPSPFEASVSSYIDVLDTSGRNIISAELIFYRRRLLEETISARRRGVDFQVPRLLRILQLLGTRGSNFLDALTKVSILDALTRLSREIKYTEMVAQGLVDGEYSQLATILLDLADAALPETQRIALFEILQSLEPLRSSIQKYIESQSLNADQKARLASYSTLITKALTSFALSSDPGSLLDILRAELENLFKEALGTLEETRSAIGRFSAMFLDSATLSSILSTDTDNRSRMVIGELSASGQLAILPTRYKLALVENCIAGNAGDDDEDAILRVLDDTDQADRVELYQLVSAIGWEKLNFNLDGEQNDRFFEILDCVDEPHGAEPTVMVSLETGSGPNGPFIDTATGSIVTRQQFSDIVQAGRYPGYHAQRVGAFRIIAAHPTVRSRTRKLASHGSS
jgi:hypothetical protein